MAMFDDLFRDILVADYAARRAAHYAKGGKSVIDQLTETSEDFDNTEETRRVEKFGWILFVVVAVALFALVYGHAAGSVS